MHIGIRRIAIMFSYSRYMYVYIHSASMHACMHAWMYACSEVCMCVYIYIHRYMQIHTCIYVFSISFIQLSLCSFIFIISFISAQQPDSDNEAPRLGPSGSMQLNQRWTEKYGLHY